MSTVSARTGLVVTNPRSIYQSLVSTGRIKPDHAQARLSVQLQKLYYRLKDYEPEIEYKHRLEQLTRSIQLPQSTHLKPQRSLLSSIWQSDIKAPNLSLTPTIPIYDSALSIQSPQGMLLHGEVGRGKSMLLDLLAESLPSRKKRRWHFNSFMLEIFRRLERLRIDRAHTALDHEHSVLALARDTISSTPILFLDEFQLPDRAASKLLSSFLTAFFHLGGVMIATSNRMPEELANAAGIEFYPEPRGAFGSFKGMLGMKKTAAQRAASSDFGAFLEVLKARCEVWEMEGEKDWRRYDLQPTSEESKVAELPAEPGDVAAPLPLVSPTSTNAAKTDASKVLPQYYHTADSPTSLSLDVPIPKIYTPHTLTIYSRPVYVPAQTSTGYTRWTFTQLCATNLGPADYITLASTYHTLILTAVPVLTGILKNEARRFITLLDALYESRCRLLIAEASAPIDQLFFPTTPASPEQTPKDASVTEDAGDAIASESISEIYQDRTSPFRPNISSYTPSSVLADEDADFGPTYGHGRSASPSVSSSHPSSLGPDFTNPTLLTGQDERFAFRRAESRLWEMCGARWWDARRSDAVDMWHRPVSAEGRFWESTSRTAAVQGGSVQATETEGRDVIKDRRKEDAGGTEEDSGSGGGSSSSLSPFRTHPQPPPRFTERHFWDLGLWGRKAGRWGRGVEGLERRGEGRGEVGKDGERDREREKGS